MNLRDLECFFAVADEQHFRRAAERLSVSQATVSQAVRRLEGVLGGVLFDRSTRLVTLTPLGAEFLRSARPAHAELIEAYETARRTARERPDTFVLAYARETAGSLLDLVRAAPSATIELRNMPTPAQLTALRRRRIHAGIGWETAASEGIETEIVTRTSLVALAPDTHPLAQRETIHIGELAREPIVGWPRGLSPELTSLVGAAIEPTGSWTFSASGTTLDDIVGHVISGRGIGIFPESLLAGRAVTGVRKLAIHDAPIVHEMLIWRSGEPHPLLDVVRHALGASSHGGPE